MTALNIMQLGDKIKELDFKQFLLGGGTFRKLA